MESTCFSLTPLPIKEHVLYTWLIVDKFGWPHRDCIKRIGPIYKLLHSEYYLHCKHLLLSICEHILNSNYFTVTEMSKYSQWMNRNFKYDHLPAYTSAKYVIVLINFTLALLDLISTRQWVVDHWQVSIKWASSEHQGCTCQDSHHAIMCGWVSACIIYIYLTIYEYWRHRIHIHVLHAGYCLLV